MAGLDVIDFVEPGRMPHAIDVSLDASIDAVMALQADVDAFSETHDLSPRTTYVLQLILEELLTNVVNHGYEGQPDGTVIVRLSRENELTVGEIIDSGRAFDPTGRADPDTSAPLDDRPIGGLGVHLSRTLANELTYERVDDRNVVRFTVSDDAPPPKMENSQ
ncbi:ATP-binding protein [Amorphus orientalis]|uniref:Anti-sigma regulatory factor (Ser/Thr protein kinase) n=1 Tax=Amorphus orientalis TaxID=649198 RepID=A0AAE3VST7_9HYPH|nr:ATP-binding protein [Amorphus orientalis]MDQ0317540.1 anti-sigma regulatory factor (Ser/Thr protein kinase) [Amorphus orientalis]